MKTSARFASLFLPLLTIPALAGPPSTTTTLTFTSAGSAVTTVTRGDAVKLTATVKAGGTAISPGQVNFCDASATYCSDIHVLGTAQLTTAGKAAITLLPNVGTHEYKAVFLGTKNYAGSSSGVATLAVTGTTPSSTMIAQSGLPGNYSLTATVGGIAATAPTGTVSFLDATESNALLGTASLGAGVPGFTFLNTSNPTPAGIFPVSLAAADFNGDGKPDLVVETYSYASGFHIAVLPGDGQGNFGAPIVSPASGQPSAMVVGDFNGDGIPDLALDLSGTVEILSGNGDGSFRSKSTSTIGGGSYSLVTGDFNRDGNADLAAVNSANSTVTILLGNGDGTFTATPVSPATGGGAYSIAVGDFNGDGIPDLATANNYPGSLTVLLGKGDGTFTSVAPPQVDGPTSLVAADFNGDGNQDLAVTSDGVVQIFLGGGNGTFSLFSVKQAGNGPGAIAVVDLNGDGVADLVVANLSGNEGDTASALLGSGDGTFSSLTFPVGAAVQTLVAADFNGDGRSDLAFGDYNIYPATGITHVAVLVPATQTATATASGIAVVPEASGAHQVVASYGGDSENGATVSAPTSLTAIGGATATTLTVDSNPSAPGTLLTFTAHVSQVGGPGIPVGKVQFTVDGVAVKEVTLAYGGYALYYTVLPIGNPADDSHLIVANYLGGLEGYKPSSSPFILEQGNRNPAAPIILPLGGTYRSSQVVTMQSPSAGATIYYTTDGSNPSYNSRVYTGPITVSSNTTINAVTYLNGYVGGQATAIYNFVPNAIVEP